MNPLRRMLKSLSSRQASRSGIWASPWPSTPGPDACQGKDVPRRLVVNAGLAGLDAFVNSSTCSDRAGSFLTRVRAVIVMKSTGFISVLVALGMLVGSPALAEQEVDKTPDWKRAPSEQDFLAVVPRAAMQAGVGGKVRLSCRVTAAGALTGCRILSEEPPGMGFGQAALTLMPQMLMTPAIKDGKAVDYDGVTIPITFPKPSGSTGSRISGAQAPGDIWVSVLSSVPWTATPSTEDIWEAYPPAARERRLSGRITLECTIQKDGGLSGCQSQNKDPDSEALMPAARALAKKFRAPLRFDEGKSTAGSHVLVPFDFQVDQAKVPTFATRLPWLAIPAGDRFQAELSPLLKGAGAKEVRLKAECAVGPDSHLRDCTVLNSTPEIAGLQPAVNRLAPGFILPRWTDTGTTYVGGKVMLPVRYSLPEPGSEGSP